MTDEELYERYEEINKRIKKLKKYLKDNN